MKEITPNQIVEWCVATNGSLNISDQIRLRDMIVEYGKQCHNRAVDSCLHNAYCDSDVAMEYNTKMLPKLKI